MTGKLLSNPSICQSKGKSKRKFFPWPTQAGGAAANTTAEAIGRGLSNRQAYTLGAIAGMAEIVTEKVSLDTLLDKTSLNKSAWGYVAKNMLAEGSEEMASDLINWAGDVLVAKDKGQWKQAIQAYKDQGMGEKEAFQLALKDQLIDMGMSGLGGTLSGGLMSGGSVALDGIQQWAMETKQLPVAGEVAETQKTTSQRETVKIDPGARKSVREQLKKMPSEGYQIPYITMPKEALLLEDGSSVPESKIPSAIRRYMAKLFKGKVLNVGKDHTVYIDKGGVREFTFPAKRLTEELKTAKMTAGANLDTTLESAQYLKNGDDDGRHPEATGGWDYFYVMFETNTGIYSGIVKTMVTDRGRVFHDITEIQKESGPSTHGVNGETPPPAKTGPLSSDSIISTLGDGVNSEHV